MNLVAACATLRTLSIGFSIGFRYISSSLRAALLPAAPLLFVIGLLAAIVISHYLREKRNQDIRGDKGRSDSRPSSSRDSVQDVRIADLDDRSEGRLLPPHPQVPERNIAGGQPQEFAGSPYQNRYTGNRGTDEPV